MRIGLIGAPTSAGAYSPGQEDAPAALRDAGIVAALDAVDLGDIPRFRWRPDRSEPRAMNAAAVRAGALAVADKVAGAGDLVPLVLGGDCTVELGVVRALGAGAALVYVDPHPDMNTPDTVPDGAFDWMGVAHMLGLEGTHPDVEAVASLAPEQVLILGQSVARTTGAEQAAIDRLGIAAITEDEVRIDPVAAARRALEWAGDRPVLVHFDVDSVDSADMPLAENTDRNVGLSFAAVVDALGVLLGAGPAALTITELNPHHGAPLGPLIDALASSLSPR